MIGKIYIPILLLTASAFALSSDDRESKKLAGQFFLAADLRSAAQSISAMYLRGLPDSSNIEQESRRKNAQAEFSARKLEVKAVEFLVMELGKNDPEFSLKSVDLLNEIRPLSDLLKAPATPDELATFQKEGEGTANSPSRRELLLRLERALKPATFQRIIQSQQASLYEWMVTGASSGVAERYANKSTSDLEEKSRQHLVFAVRGISDDELEGYVAKLESPIGQYALGLAAGSIFYAIEEQLKGIKEVPIISIGKS